ncbi:MULTISPECIES: VOC family protein [Actinomadura]|uniref:VOC family protein n=2 Tax=Actinomadura TaxID=1988 RepID=A0A5D0TZM5_9ACTN|nr:MULTISPECIES: VOC family protein [Actinomadura]TYC10339.1 VOC family protein [Actinomadura syzygii]TYK52414.1 VOC family protein [Actinomadura decatromicini]
MSNQKAHPFPEPLPVFHHIAVQTNDLENSQKWYEAFFGARPTFTQEIFSDLTNGRLPGIRRLVEMTVGTVRIHLFEREGRPAPAPGESVTQYQHLCLAVSDPQDLVTIRRHWIDLFESGRFDFAVKDPPSPIVVDDGVSSFYTFDVNGLEFEFTHVPRAA